MCTSYANRDYRVAVFLDNANINASFHSVYGAGANLERVLDAVLMGNKLHRAIAYSVRHGDMERWLKFMGHIGFEVKVKDLLRRGDDSVKADWDIGICLDVVNQVLRGTVDVVVLLSGDGDFVDLIKWCQARGVIVVVAAVSPHTAIAVKEHADKFISLRSELALEKKDAQRRVVVRTDPRTGEELCDVVKEKSDG